MNIPTGHVLTFSASNTNAARSAARTMAAQPAARTIATLPGQKQRSTVPAIASLIKKGAVHPATRGAAIGVLKRRGVRPGNQLAEVDAIASEVSKQVRFTRDPWKTEAIGEVADTAHLGGGDCDDLAVMTGALLASIGYPVRLRLVGKNRLSHVMVEAQINGKWMPVDTAKIKGWMKRDKWPLEQIVGLDEAEALAPGFNTYRENAQQFGRMPFENLGWPCTSGALSAMPFSNLGGGDLGFLPALIPLAAQALPALTGGAGGATGGAAGGIMSKITGIFGGGTKAPNREQRMATYMASASFKTPKQVSQAVYDAAMAGDSAALHTAFGIQMGADLKAASGFYKEAWFDAAKRGMLIPPGGKATTGAAGPGATTPAALAQAKAQAQQAQMQGPPGGAPGAGLAPRTAAAR